jgi:hypothetical protein
VRHGELRSRRARLTSPNVSTLMYANGITLVWIRVNRVAIILHGDAFIRDLYVHNEPHSRRDNPPRPHCCCSRVCLTFLGRRSFSIPPSPVSDSRDSLSYMWHEYDFSQLSTDRRPGHRILALSLVLICEVQNCVILL